MPDHVRQQDRAEFQVEGNLTPQLADGHVVAVHGFFRDITDRVKAENEVRALNADLERRVADRTVELEQVNHALQDEIADRTRLEETLRRSRKSWPPPTPSWPGRHGSRTSSSPT